MVNETRKQMTAGVMISYMVIIVQFLTGLIYTPIMLRTLGQSQYGIYSLCTSFMGYFTIMNGGINAAYIRFYVQTKVKESHRVAGLNGIFLKIFITLAFIALVGGWLTSIYSPYIFGNKISSEEYYLVEKCFKLLAFSSFLQILNCVYSSLIIAQEKFIFAKTMNLVIAILNPVMTIPFLLKGYSCDIVIIIHLLTMAITFCANLLFCKFVLKVNFDFSEKDKGLICNIAQFAGFIVLQSIMDQLNWQIDKFILARTQGSGDISLYSVGATFNKYYIMFSGALSGVFIAQINKLQALSDLEGINKLFIRTSRVFAYLIWLFMSGYIIFGHPFVKKWAGLDYVDSYYIGILLMLPVTASLTMGLGQDIARAMNKHQLQIIINLGVCIVNLCISIPLAMKWGAIGSAIGTFLAEILICIIIEPIYYKKVIGLDIKNLLFSIRKIAIGMIIPIIYGVIICSLGIVKESYFNIFAWAVLYILLYFCSMYFIAMNVEEKDKVKKIIGRLNFLRK